MMNSKNSNCWNLFLSLLVSYIALVLFGFVGIYCVHCIPFERIKNNVESSSVLIHQEGYYNLLQQKFHLCTNNNVYTLDGWTDALMLMETCNTGQCDVLKTAMLNGVIWEDAAPFDYVQDYTSRKGEKGTYGRYWHGYLVSLIPALVIMDLSQIRFLNIFLFVLILSGIIFLTIKKIGKATACIFVLTIAICVFFPIVPYSMQFSSVFYVSFFSTLCLLYFENLWRKKQQSLIFFFVVGALTSYVDLLTAPLITLGFPLIFYGLLNKKNVSLKDIIILCALWSLGYLIMWSTKWGIAYVVTGYNMIENAVKEVNLRLGSNDEIGIVDVFIQVIKMIPVQMKCLIIFLLLYWCFSPKKKKEVMSNMWLLFIAVIPMVWLCVLKNHTSIHNWFTWRNLFVSCFALLLFVYNSTEYKFIHVVINQLLKKNINYEK